MKNRKRIILSIVFVSILVIGVTALCVWNSVTNYNTTLNRNWGISIPSKVHYCEIYSKHSGPSFHGDGIRYHIFSYEEHVPVKGMFTWESDQKQTIYYGYYSNAVDAWLDIIAVSPEYRPDYSDCLYWYGSQEDHSEIIILWSRTKNRLYIVESFL